VIAAALGLAAVAAVVVYRRLGSWLAGLVVGAAALLVPVHVAALVEIAGLTDRLSWGVVVAAQAVLVAALTRLHRELPSAGQPRDPWVVRSAVVLGLGYLVFALDAITGLPKHWDAVEYHLPLAVRWVQDGSLALPTSGLWQFSLPANAEIPMMALLGLGVRSVPYAANILALALLTLSVYRLTVVLVGRQPFAAYPALLVLTLPLVLFQAFSGYVDLFGTAFLFAGVAALVEFGERRGPWLAVAMLATGIAVGTKPTMWPYALVVGFLALTHLRNWRDAGVAVACACAPCAFWFVRATLETGSPFYPIAVELFGRTIFEGLPASEITTEDFQMHYVRTTLEWPLYPWLEYKREGFAYSPESGLGAAFAAFVPLGVVLAARRAWLRKDGLLRALLGLMLLGGVVWWFALQRLPRFGLPLIVGACILSVVLFDHESRLGRRWTGPVFLAATVITTAIACFQPVLDTARRLRYGTDWNSVYHLPPIFDSLPAGSRLLLMAGHNNYRFAGSELQYRTFPRWEFADVGLSEIVDREAFDYLITTADHEIEGLPLTLWHGPDDVTIWRLDARDR
jgi:hypothetical protein